MARLRPWPSQVHSNSYHHNEMLSGRLSFVSVVGVEFCWAAARNHVANSRKPGGRD
jgi:hypothetical protein